MEKLWVKERNEAKKISSYFEIIRESGISQFSRCYVYI